MRPELNVYVVDTAESLTSLHEYAKQYDKVPFTLDLETDSSSEKKAKIHGIGMCWNADEAFYIPVRDNQRNVLWSAEQLAGIFHWIAGQCRSHKLIGHNLVYDTLVFENNSGIRISDYVYSDTILLKHSVDEERPFGLKEIAVKYLGEWADKAQDAMKESVKRNGGKVTKEEFEMWKSDSDVLAEYCGWDCLLTRRLFDIFEARIEAEGLSDLFYRDEIMPLYREVTIDMKRKGFTVDVPYFEELDRKIVQDIRGFEDSILTTISPMVAEFVVAKLNEEVPVKNSGNFRKAVFDKYKLKLPTDKKDPTKVTFAAGRVAVAKLSAPVESHAFYDWAVAGGEFPGSPEDALAIQTEVFLARAINEGKRYVFNLKSDDHLRWLFFTKLGLEPKKMTESGEPSVDADTLDELAGQNPFADLIIDYKKLCKLQSTYIQGVLSREIDGVIYASMLQFGTTSGRFSSRDPNLQNLPRVKDEEAKLAPIVLEYTNAIKRGFIAPPGYVILNADYSQLEPMCFAHMSGDEKLREVFRRGYDLYSQIAIDVFGLEGFSADKKAPNYLGKHRKEMRQKAKVFCLAVVYGAEAGRISKAMGVEYQEAQDIIDAYLDAYPELQKFMDGCDQLATRKGISRTVFGRIRHIPQAKEIHSRWGDKLLFNRRWVKEQGLDDIRYKLKNALNNSKNFPIQGLAAHIVNRAMLETVRGFRNESIDGWIAMSVHDEVCCIVKKEQAARAAEVLQHAMENTTKLSVPLSAVPIIADNWSDAK